jgi:cytochrome o ubiquinol oxidase subunit 2
VSRAVEKGTLVSGKCSIATLIATVLLAGCAGVLDPAGPIGAAQRTLLLDAMSIMLVIVVPTILATLGMAWWYRASNEKAEYRPSWSYSGRLELIVWSIPTLVVLFLGGVTWLASHQLDPAQPLHSNSRPLEIQVVSLDWKWLFIYPQQGIASINRLPVPVGTPLHLRITSASVFNVFFVPQLGSMIYSMNGMMTELNLKADRPGAFPGLSAHFSGDGFSGMSFDAEAVDPAEFDAWAQRVRASGPKLDESEYRRLLRQSQNVKPYTYRTVENGLFDDILLRKLPPGEGPETTLPRIAQAKR